MTGPGTPPGVTRYRADGTPYHLTVNVSRDELRPCNNCGKLSFRSLCEYHWVYQKIRDKYVGLGMTTEQAQKCASIAADSAWQAVERRVVTHMAYVHAESTLYYDFGDNGRRKTTGMVSGPYGKGAAPPGLYYLARPIIIAPNEANKPYTDAVGFAWFARLFPLFLTNRTGLGVHPDGNIPGTLGCLGVTERSTRKFHDWLCVAPDPMFVQVIA